ncbi:cyclic AMP-dependent transcription factor ATF-6 alpha [Caerostris extrusa]|uniref:Cyclic AMP-dependent transcription factor ATF-6 alpha n=1 Tax=Caerostris extrusa TaxID=172846 RepID=A0AAV4THM1_CAEEX|nr:cyclic AMP-dependent transcription factor ATF-6 alpha [Caerostris extrusa]
MELQKQSNKELKFQTEQQNGYIQSQDLDFEKEHFGNTTIDDILKECFKDSDINDVYSIDTPEQLSPYSNGRTSLENEVPLIHIPDEEFKRGIDHVLSDTPPHTPPSLMEQASYSPPKNSPNSIVVSLNTVPAMTYVVPATQLQPAIKPIKPRVNIKPKPTSSDPSIIRLNSNEGFYIANTIMDQTTEQIVKLPNRIFCVKEPVSCITKPTTQSVSIPPSNCIDGKNGINKCQLIEACSAALKRKERIIKNRESASLSRKRRREYVQKLEGALNQVTAENANLKEENNILKCKIIALQNEISKLKGAFLSKGAKKGIFYMFAICLVTYNVASIGSIFTKDIKPIKTDIGNNNNRVGRILLWNEENSSREMNSSRPLFHNFLKEEENSHYIVAWDKSDNSSTCQQFINKTESLRLENDLLGWVKRVEKKTKAKGIKTEKGIC